MKVTIVDNTPSAMTFKISGVNDSFANALRRVVINSVPCFAVDRVTFYENTSALFDEYISQRIGLIPLLTPKGYSEKDKILFTLEAEGPCTVYSKDMKSDDKNVLVANEKVPIIKLAQGQRLKLDGQAILENARTSSKFQPGLATYKQLSDDEFEFYIETFGQMDAKEILNRALNIITEDLKKLAKEIEK